MAKRCPLLLQCDNKLVIIQGKAARDVSSEFYQDAKGRSELRDTLRELEGKSASDKEARTAYLSILKAISGLEEYGTRMGMPYVRHVRGEVWELRPKTRRVLFFYWRDNTFLLLHSFVKKRRKRRDESWRRPSATNAIG